MGKKIPLKVTLFCKIFSFFCILHLPHCIVDSQALRSDLLRVDAGVGGDVEDEHLVEEGEGHDQEQGA